ncbi:probable starch synthase 4, chloroplastic/amyloplastic isoform X1 [Zingiber officinale]|uniref:probable starch synthase 4, chloroplastic/amyloplastic isoform X1 n=2 Tax=Zingiber officinale TaxID=94328 RepID=UPI001C4B8628|nr:probable starch synthase 4, chloroplastic/amyloplastic isoform X1 [Zingiber officinale]XP_042456434.1 probable starch synthase 4, chloroplastic/amyloplastic isoform X1 [Zingiber officinale]XP_042456435.1 probable starch synthase 4, chloroplastic/amyloplastic isoform X1 [Zingiber officinale]XP_042456436.1 probable starch synthase 4, chloroplastic/amyloplastic isoform X1 [Zingiber officinale]
MAWKKDSRIRDAYLACESKGEHERLTTFLKLTYTSTRTGLHIILIAAEMAPVAKVGGLGDVITGLGKALQRKGHLVEIVLPKYDYIQYDLIADLKALDVVIESYFDGQLFRNKIWVGTIEGLPVYLIEPHHPAKFFWRGTYYGEHDDFKRFSFFSRAALELLYEAGKRPDIIHCHDWQTTFVAPLYWDIYAAKGLNSARICFTRHNFEHQGTYICCKGFLKHEHYFCYFSFYLFIILVEFINTCINLSCSFMFVKVVYISRSKLYQFLYICAHPLNFK